MSLAALRQKKYALAHPERIAAANKKWGMENRAAKTAYDKDWATINKDKTSGYRKKYREANKPLVAARQKRWRDANIEKVRNYCNVRRALKLSVSSGNVDIIRLLSVWNGLCGICKDTAIGKYHIDHIIPLTKGGLHIQTNLQITHPYCNLSKGNKVLI